jgi:hypothetical protein
MHGRLEKQEADGADDWHDPYKNQRSQEPLLPSAQFHYYLSSMEDNAKAIIST